MLTPAWEALAVREVARVDRVALSFPTYSQTHKPFSLEGLPV